MDSKPTKSDFFSKVAVRGTRMASDIDLICAILSLGKKCSEKESDEIRGNAEKIYEVAGENIFNLSRLTIEDFESYGLKLPQARALAIALEFSRRFEDRIESIRGAILSSSDRVFEYFQGMARDLDVEKCWVVSLNTKNQLIRCDEVSSGIANSSNFHPRDFLRPAVRANAISIILVHNHPSGDASPSPEDRAITQRLQTAAKTLSINFLDHVIIGRRSIGPFPQGYYSFLDSGEL